MSFELNKFGTALQSLQSSWATLNQQIKTLENDKTTLEERVNEFAQTNSALTQQNTTLSKDNIALQAQVQDLTEALAKKPDATARIQELEQELARYKAIVAEAAEVFSGLAPRVEKTAPATEAPRPSSAPTPLATTAPPQKSSPTEKPTDEAKKQDLKKRATDLEAKYKANTKDPKVLFDLAKTYFDLKQNEKALEKFREVEPIYGDKKWTLSHYMARTYTRLNNLKLGLEYAERAINEEPSKNNGDHYLVLANVAIKNKMKAKAAWAINEAKRCKADVSTVEKDFAKLASK